MLHITGDGSSIEVDLQGRESETMDGYQQQGGDGGTTGIEETHSAEPQAHQGGQRNGEVLHTIVR